MLPIWKPQPIEVYREWLDTILKEASDDLNDWETNFIDSITIHLAKGYSLSERQANILERIYAHKTK